MEPHPLTLVWQPPQWVGTMTEYEKLTQGYIVKSVLEEHTIVYCEMMDKDQEALKRIGHFVPSKVKDGYANLPSIVDLRDEYLLEGETVGAMPGDWAKDDWDALSPDFRRKLQVGWPASVYTSYTSDSHNAHVPFRLTTCTKVASRC